MTLLWPSSPAVTAPAGSGRRGVTLLSGFLGSGKTTLLQAELARTGTEAPAVIVNDYGNVMVDDMLLTRPQNRHPAVLPGGCACCTRLDDLAQLLAGLLDEEQRRATQPSGHVVIEASGLADPGPIAFTLANDPILKHHYVLARVCVTVDAVTGLTSIQHHDVALRQLLAADDILITKADLTAPHEVTSLAGQLQLLNPSAAVTVTARGQRLSGAGKCATQTSRYVASPPGSDRHVHDVSTLELMTSDSLDWQAFALWLSLLVHEHGPDILRIKGIADVENVGPVAINGVQHIVHSPEHLSGSIPPGTRIVIITQGLDASLVERSFHAFLGIAGK